MPHMAHRESGKEMMDGTYTEDQVLHITMPRGSVLIFTGACGATNALYRSLLFFSFSFLCNACPEPVLTNRRPVSYENSNHKKSVVISSSFLLSSSAGGLVHGAGENRSERGRKSILSGYQVRDETPFAFPFLLPGFLSTFDESW